MTEYSLDTPFYIDDGELDDVSPRDAFVLGAEFAIFHTAIMSDASDFTMVIHRKNIDRCVAACTLLKRKTSVVAREGSPRGWSTLHVGARMAS